MSNEPNNTQGFEPQATKISPEMAVVWDKVCQALGSDTYHILQQFIYSMVRMASEQHRLTPEFEKLMTMLDSDVAWQNAINLCAPNGKYNISQMVLIVEQKDKKGFAMVMLDKPFMGECRQTENVNYILDRVLEVGTNSLYRKLRTIKADMKCEWTVDQLLTMIEQQNLLNIEEEDRQEFAGQNIFYNNGKEYKYGKKAKSFHHRTVDSLANSKTQQRILFDDSDAESANAEAEYTPEEWEGNHRQPTGDDVVAAMGCYPIGAEP